MVDFPQQKSSGRIRPGRMGDVRAIHGLLTLFAARGLMLPRSISSLYDHLRDFVVYEEDGSILGICALHICWDNLAEIRSLAVSETQQKRGIGAQLVESCLDEARSLEIDNVFVLTYQAAFFRRFGFVDCDKQELPHKIWSDCLHCSKFPDCDEDALIRRASSPS
ncbi:N-acetyltransferase [Desulfobulbus alkaliphilus]|uniref:N-acetyltransferase n=1 Tax=Desulfobulbus alkaliphilus TaxID=869814 RepID=UPI0019641976|nr:N-acetyltransferase [Desulfobulbus alkaliphilus]MBM9535493.1 N-acetyltransferase [Desulfobulbus alkaliphilus]